MIKQYFIPYGNSAICSTIWFGNSEKIALILPSVALRSMAGIRYYTAILASRLNKVGYNVITFDYPGTGNSEGGDESLGLMEMMRSSETVYNFVEREFQSSVDLVVGVAAGNLIAAMMQKNRDIGKTILLNPDYDGLQGHCRELMINETCLFIESNFTTDNGSDATFTVLNMENPNNEVRFWDALVGPFYGGESEIISTKLIQDIKEYNFVDLIKDSKASTVAFYWSNWFPDSKLNKQCTTLKTIDCGRLTNKGYWVESSQLFDKTIKEVMNYVDLPINEDIGDHINPYALMRKLEKYTKQESNDTFVQSFTVNSREEPLVGLLYGPRKSTKSKKPIVIFEHGLCCDNVGEYRAWYTFSMELAKKGYYSIRYDHIGSGVSGGQFDNTSYDNYLNDLQSIIEWQSKTNLETNGKVIMVSWSFGVNISLLISRKDSRIDQLVLWSPVLENGTATTKIKFFRNDNGNIVFPISPLWLPSEFLNSEKKMSLEDFDTKTRRILLVTGDMDNEDLYKPFSNRISYEKNGKHIIIKNAGHCFSMSTIENVINSTISWIREDEIE